LTPESAKCLDHTASKKQEQIVPSVTGKVYNCSKRMKEKRAVLDGVAAEVQRIIGQPRRRTQRTIRGGIVLYARTSLAWLPSTKRPKPRRPCDAITMRSQPCFSAVAMIPSAGAWSGT